MVSLMAMHHNSRSTKPFPTLEPGHSTCLGEVLEWYICGGIYMRKRGSLYMYVYTRTHTLIPPLGEVLFNPGEHVVNNVGPDGRCIGHLALTLT